MQPIKHISIPQPCHEDWQQMTPVTQGRHCQSCCKTVMDFTAMSNTEVISYLASHQNICGKIEETQLAGINYQLQAESKRQFSWKGLLTAASLSVLFPAMNAQAQTLSKATQLFYSSSLHGKAASGNKSGLVTIKGKVTSAEDGQPIIGVSVMVKGKAIGTQTAADGSFKLRLLNVTDTLTISSVGYKSVEISAGLKSTNFDISLELAPTALNDVQVAGYPSTVKRCITLGAIATVNGKKVPFYLRWWYWLVHKAKHILMTINPF